MYKRQHSLHSSQSKLGHQHQQGSSYSGYGFHDGPVPLRPLVNQLRAWLGDGHRVVLVSPNRAHADRLDQQGWQSPPGARFGQRL